MLLLHIGNNCCHKGGRFFLFDRVFYLKRFNCYWELVGKISFFAAMTSFGSLVLPFWGGEAWGCLVTHFGTRLVHK